jgi:putative membrane protein
MTEKFICLLIFIISVAGLSSCAKNSYSTNSTAANGSTYNSEFGNTSNTAYNSSNAMTNSASNAGESASDDNDFMKEAAVGGMAEVEMGKLAATKATSADVKKFGQMMVDDHTKANNDLKALAAKKGVTLPTDLDSSHKATMDDLREQAAADFDKEYVEEMVDDHEEDVAKFEDEAKNATDPDVRAFAQKTQPVLQKHLDAIKSIQAKMK